MLKIVFMGSDAIALPALEWFAACGLAEVVAVFTQPDRAAGRGQKVQANAIKTWAQARGLPVHQPARFAAAEYDVLLALKPDLTLVMAYGHILKQEVIDAPRLGTLNLHTSILPRYRGASPIQTAIASGDPMTGVTLMKLVLKLDAGPVADVEQVPIASLDTAAEVEAKLSAACVPLLRRCLPAIASGEQTFVAQDENAATYCRKLEKSDGVLNFSASAAVLAARINGLNPWPGCSLEIAGQLVKVGLADVVLEPSQQPPGTVLGQDEAGVRVATADGVLRLRRLQRPGGRMLEAGEFVRGFPLSAGLVLPSRPMPPLVGPEPFPFRKT